MKTIYTCFIFIFFFSKAYTQEAGKSSATAFEYFTDYSTFYLGYEYHQENYAKLGYGFYLVQANNNILNLDAGVGLTYANKKVVAIPEVSTAYLFNTSSSDLNPYSSNVGSAFYVARLSVSPWHIHPKVGLSILSLLELNAGYGFEFRDNPNVQLNGFSIGLNLRIPFLLFTGR